MANIDSKFITMVVASFLIMAAASIGLVVKESTEPLIVPAINQLLESVGIDYVIDPVVI